MSDPTRPRVTIVMNIRNGATTLEEAIESALRQTFTNWELLVWDDRSTDGSAAIVSSFTDPRIRYLLAPEDVPLGQARDQAIREARGEWLAFLDQDDLWLPDKLELQLALADESPDAALIYGRALSFSARMRDRDYDKKHEYAALPEGDIFMTLVADCCYIAMSSAMIRKSAIESVGGIPHNIHITPDYFLYLGLTSSYPARAVQQVICRYRLHETNTSNFTRQRMHEEILWLIDQWAHRVPPPLAAWRRKVHHTVVAYEEMRRWPTAAAGVQRLLTRGSVMYLLSRPFERLLRIALRRVRRPYWRLVSENRSTAVQKAGSFLADPRAHRVD